MDNEEEIEETLDCNLYLIEQYISDEECDNDFDCKNCCDYDSCFITANSRCNSEFAESIDYGGYDSEEEFWEQLFD